MREGMKLYAFFSGKTHIYRLDISGLEKARMKGGSNWETITLIPRIQFNFALSAYAYSAKEILIISGDSRDDNDLDRGEERHIRLFNTDSNSTKPAL